jgi:hypothetical protein
VLLQRENVSQACNLEEAFCTLLSLFNPLVGKRDIVNMFSIKNCLPQTKLQLMKLNCKMLKIMGEKRNRKKKEKRKRL